MNRNGDKRQAPRDSGGLRADWRVKASCRGYVVDHFDPWDADPNDGKVNPTAESICKHCPVQRDCLLEGLRNDQLNGGVAFGVWGGLAPRQRRALVRLRYRVGCPVCHGKLVITPEGEEWQACARCGVTWRCRKPAAYITHDSGQSS